MCSKVVHKATKRAEEGVASVGRGIVTEVITVVIVVVVCTIATIITVSVLPIIT